MVVADPSRACSKAQVGVFVHPMKLFATILLTSAVALLSACGQQPSAATAAPKKDIRIVVKTNKGDIEATIFASKAPVTAANFLNLAKRGYYNDVRFHRVIPGFMAQGGDPTETGRGGPGYKFEDEVKTGLKHDKPGIFSMANAGPRTNGSQFFITYVPTPHLNGRHTVFGEVTNGMSVPNSLNGKLSGPGWKTNGIGDKIISIKILDSTDELFKLQEKNLKSWNKTLDQRYPVKK